MRKIVVADASLENDMVTSLLVEQDGAAEVPTRKKILVAAGSLCPGSVARVLFDVILGIPDYHFLIWVAPGQEKTSIATAEQCLENLGVEWLSNVHFLRSSRQAEMLSPEIKATFVNLFTEDSWYMPLSLERGIPIITFSHSVSYFEDYPFVSNPLAPKVVWQRRAYLLATKIICWSHLEKEFISRFLPVVREKIEVIPLCQGIAEEVNRPRTSPRGRALTVLFAGRPLARRKGFEHLASAARELAARGCQIRLAVADAFTNAEKLARIRFADLLDGIAVKWLRDLNQEEMRTLYQSVDVVVVPSVYDSWCKVVTEAIAEGTPVIATDGTGAAEFFSHDEVPRVRAGDSKALVHAIECLVSNYPDRLAATQRARDRLKAELTLEKHAARLRQVIGLDPCSGPLGEAR